LAALVAQQSKHSPRSITRENLEWASAFVDHITTTSGWRYADLVELAQLRELSPAKRAALRLAASKRLNRESNHHARANLIAFVDLLKDREPFSIVTGERLVTMLEAGRRTKTRQAKRAATLTDRNIRLADLNKAEAAQIYAGVNPATLPARELERFVAYARRLRPGLRGEILRLAQNDLTSALVDSRSWRNLAALVEAFQ
jgi:hypothetical protein